MVVPALQRARQALESAALQRSASDGSGAGAQWLPAGVRVRVRKAGGTEWADVPGLRREVGEASVSAEPLALAVRDSDEKLTQTSRSALIRVAYRSVRAMDQTGSTVDVIFSPPEGPLVPPGSVVWAQVHCVGADAARALAAACAAKRSALGIVGPPTEPPARAEVSPPRAAPVSDAVPTPPPSPRVASAPRSCRKLDGFEGSVVRLRDLQRTLAARRHGSPPRLVSPPRPPLAFSPSVEARLGMGFGWPPQPERAAAPVPAEPPSPDREVFVSGPVRRRRRAVTPPVAPQRPPRAHVSPPRPPSRAIVTPTRPRPSAGALEGSARQQHHPPPVEQQRSQPLPVHRQMAEADVYGPRLAHRQPPVAASEPVVQQQPLPDPARFDAVVPQYPVTAAPADAVRQHPPPAAEPTTGFPVMPRYRPAPVTAAPADAVRQPAAEPTGFPADAVPQIAQHRHPPATGFPDAVLQPGQYPPLPPSDFPDDAVPPQRVQYRPPPSAADPAAFPADAAMPQPAGFAEAAERPVELLWCADPAPAADPPHTLVPAPAEDGPAAAAAAAATAAAAALAWLAGWTRTFSGWFAADPARDAKSPSACEAEPYWSPEPRRRVQSPPHRGPDAGPASPLRAPTPRPEEGSEWQASISAPASTSMSDASSSGMGHTLPAAKGKGKGKGRRPPKPTAPPPGKGREPVLYPAEVVSHASEDRGAAAAAEEPLEVCRWCGRSAPVDHPQRCAYRKVLCKRCGARMTARDFAAGHPRTCPTPTAEVPSSRPPAARAPSPSVARAS
eukprot:TRINITY_DN3342_c0_g2_i1.p1 TRINITY_DN3342_c0_g2~~TRINITY_DN3342_c0_g2_i1.p1  ORF type:complete len:804 (+),score=248.11 TRINITY_DN3342_c0_g2_i1:60-2414(+)